MNCNKLLMSIAISICGLGLSAHGGVTITDFVDDSNSNTNLWDLSRTTFDDGDGRKFDGDNEPFVTSPKYEGAVVSISVSAKNVGFKKESERSLLKILAKASDDEMWTEIHQIVFANGSPTNETVSLLRSDNYRRFQLVFVKKTGTLRVSSFSATWRADGEVATPSSLKASEISSDAFHATWMSDEPVECFLFDCWKETVTSWAGSVKWHEDFSGCINQSGNSKNITDKMADEYGLAGWSGAYVYLSAGANGTVQVDTAIKNVGWLVTPELPHMENVELVVKARAFKMQPDHVMPVFIVRGGVTNELASFELSESFADCHCPVPEILEGDRLAFKSFSVGVQRRVLIDSISLVEGFDPGHLVTNVVCDGVVVENSEFPGFMVEGLDSGCQYRFSVRAVSNGVESAPSEVCMVETVQSSVTEDVGDWSGIVASEITHSSFCLDWPSLNGAVEYRVSVWTNVLAGSSSGTVLWSESFSKAMSSTSSTAVRDSEKFCEVYADNSGWTIVSNVYPSVEAGTVRIGNTTNPGELVSPPMAAISGGALRVRVRRQTSSEGAIFSVWRRSGDNLSEIGEAQEIGDAFAECIWMLPEMNEGDCLVFRSASGKKSFRTLLDEVEIREGYSLGVPTPDYALDAVRVAGTSYAVEMLPTAIWTFAVEAIDGSGAVVASVTNTVDLVNPPPRPVIDAVMLSEMPRKGGDRIWSEDFSSLATVFSKNKVDWLNGTTLPHWQAYYGGEPVTTITRNPGTGTSKGLYAYYATNKNHIAESYSLGTMTGGEADEYVYGLAFRNDTAFSVRKVVARFDGVQFGFKNEDVQELVCECLVTNELVSVAVDGDWRVCADLAYRTPKDSMSGLVSGVDLPVSTAIAAELPNVCVPKDGYFMIRWRRSAVANAAAMAVDNVSVSFTVQSRPLTIVIR